VCGTVYVQAGEVPALAIVASIPVGAIATAVLVVNNVRDLPTDVRAGKRTLVVRYGRRFGVAEYAALLAIAYATPAAVAGLGLASPLVLLAWLTIPLAARLARAVARETSGAALNPCLGATARLLVVFGALFSAGLAR
jgi:1,4-dihydroxy-2-naphthoate octaprenyltransferase